MVFKPAGFVGLQTVVDTDVLNLRVNLGDLAFIPLPLSHQVREIVAGDEGQIGLKLALLVFDEIV